MQDKVNGERKKLSLSSGGKLTLKNSITTKKSPNSVTANSRISRGTVQVEVKRTKKKLIDKASLDNAFFFK